MICSLNDIFKKFRFIFNITGLKPALDKAKQFRNQHGRSFSLADCIAVLTKTAIDEAIDNAHGEFHVHPYRYCTGTHITCAT